jgi:23S rRNA (uracil1939-C5)-methyltransferase
MGMSDQFASKPRRGETLELEVSSLAFGGQGVARRENFVMFVAGAVPGDRVRVTVTRTKRRFAEARLEEILQPSPDRVDAQCRHYGSCGGCRWQSLAYPVQLRYKTQQVRDSLERLGGLEGFELREIRGMADPWRYRNKVEFSIGEGPDGLPVVGFRPPGRWDEVVPLSECRFLARESEEVRDLVETWLREKDLAPWHPRRLTGYARHLTVRQAHVTGEILVSLVTAPGPLPAGAELVARLRERLPGVVGVLHATNDGPAEVAGGLPYETLWGRPHLYEELDGLRLKISLDAFFQTNTRMARVLYEITATEARLSGHEVVWDLYSGIGSIALYLARQARAVLGIEVVKPAVADARVNAAENAAENVTFLEGDARVLLKRVLDGEASLPTGLEHPDVVVVDPPRAGLAKKVVGRIAKAAPARIVYVSCNPATMAANAAQFAELGYVLHRVTPVDMFPHTPHIEAVGLLLPAGDGPS